MEGAGAGAVEGRRPGGPEDEAAAAVEELARRRGRIRVGDRGRRGAGPSGVDGSFRLSPSSSE